MFPKKAILLFLLLAPFIGESQSKKLDSLDALITRAKGSRLQELLFLAAKTAIDDRIDSVEHYTKQILVLPGVKRDSNAIMRAIKIEGTAQRIRGNYAQGISIFEDCYDYYTRTRDTSNLVVAADQLGTMNVFMGYHEKAQQYFFEVYDIYYAQNDVKNMASATNGIAIFYGSTNQEEEAIKSYQKALAMYEQVKDTMGMANVQANLGLTYIELKRFKEAEYHLKKQGSLDSAIGTQWGLGFHFDYMGYLKQNEGKLDEALPYYKKALEIRQKLPSKLNLDETRISLAEVYYEMKNYDAAIQQAKKILEDGNEEQSLHQQVSTYEVLSNAYAAKNSFENAYSFHKKYKSISDSIYNIETNEKIAENSAKFQLQQRQAEIGLLNLENKATKQQIKQKNRAIFIVAIALILITLLCVLLFTTIKKYLIQKRNLTKTVEEKETLLKEIHHRVKNNLQLISSLLTLQGVSIENEQVQLAIQEGKSRVRSMALIHQDLYQSADLTSVNAKKYLNDLTNELVNTYDITKEKVNLELDIDNIDIDIDTLVPLGLILNELISNSLKYAFPKGKKGTIKVKLNKEKSRLKLLVKDNGIGFDEDKVAPSSFGKQLVSSLVSQLEGDLFIDTKNGTEVKIEFEQNI